VIVVGNFDLIEGQIGPEKVVDDGNLTAFIIIIIYIYIYI
jgi:hypothetical protein